MDSAEKLSDGVQKTLDNQYLFWSLMLFAIVFGWLARPPLPNWLLSWFDNPLFQYVVLFALVYTGSKDLKASFWSPLILMAIMYLLSFTENKYRKHEGFEDGEGDGEEDIDGEVTGQADGEEDETEDVVVNDTESGDVEKEEKEQEDEEDDENDEDPEENEENEGKTKEQNVDVNDKFGSSVTYVDRGKIKRGKMARSVHDLNMIDPNGRVDDKPSDAFIES